MTDDEKCIQASLFADDDETFVMSVRQSGEEGTL